MGLIMKGRYYNKRDKPLILVVGAETSDPVVINYMKFPDFNEYLQDHPEQFKPLYKDHMACVYEQIL